MTDPYLNNCCTGLCLKAARLQKHASAHENFKNLKVKCCQVKKEID
jgi:hypothetical protein